MEESFRFIYGKNKVILSAPHCVMHVRNGSIRSKETKTGIIVKNLSKKCNVCSIYKTKHEENDANWDKKCEYKSALEHFIKKEKIKALIDLHGMAAHRKQDICIGINKGANIFGNIEIVNSFIDIFNRHGFKNVTIDKPFSAEYKYCVSNYISRKCKIPTFQIEINLKYRSKTYQEYSKFNDLLDSLEEIIELVNAELV